MKKVFYLLITLITFLSAGAKNIKITVIPADAKIYIDGNYVADGETVAKLKKSEGFIVVKCEKEGYITLETKIFASDKRKAIAYTLRKDSFLDVSVVSGNTNEYFSIQISPDLYTTDGLTGKRDAEKAWKMIHQIILNYFDEIQITDAASGFVQTPWKYYTYPEADKVVRTRISVKESNLGREELTFQIKVSSEVASLAGQNIEESYREINRIVLEMEPIFREFHEKLGIL